MNEELEMLLSRLNDSFRQSGVIYWGCPIPSFGNIATSKIATVGLNPSNLEFVDADGNELERNKRRFHTLKSLGITNWVEASPKQINLIMEMCNNYFRGNPYDQWFKKLDYIISGTGISYYFPSNQACHLDLIPYATSQKWSELNPKQRSLLFETSKDTLGILLRNSPIKLLVLNGQTVVENLEKIANIKFSKVYMKEWSLPRRLHEVSGYSYEGVITSLSGVTLKSPIHVLGFNHNIQSSFGVTIQVRNAIRNWVVVKSKEFFL